MMIPYINTIDDLKEIAKSYLIEFKPISQSCLIMYILNKYNIGNIAVVSNEIICTFHYNCGDIRYVRKFKFNKEIFEEELKKAVSAFARKQRYEFAKLLNSI